MSSQFISGIIILLLGTGFISCKKDKNPTPVPTIVGYWTGNYGNGSSPTTTPFNFLFRANGTLRIYANNADSSAAIKAEGIYSVSGTKFTGTYSYDASSHYSLSGTANEQFSAMSGTWGSGSSISDGGLFIQTKVQN